MPFSEFLRSSYPLTKAHRSAVAQTLPPADYCSPVFARALIHPAAYYLQSGTVTFREYFQMSYPPPSRMKI